MKKTIILSLALAAIVGCGKEPETATNELSERYFRSWLSLNDPEGKWEKTDLGCYIISEDPGTGEALGDYEDSPYIYVDYTISDLDGTISETSELEVAKRLGTYQPTYYYGPVVTYRGSNSLYAGLEEILPRLNVGGSCKFVMPGWLQSASRYKTEEQYIKKVTGTDAIYSVKVYDRIDDITAWELDSMKAYVNRVYGSDIDTIKTGVYYIQTQAPTDTTSFSSGDEVYLNYTGRLLNGQAFDTTIEKVAKDEGLYSSGNTYEETYMNWADDYSEITMGDDETEVVEGFSYIVSLMKTGEKGVGIFYSDLGYSTTSKNAIPSYSPLIFEIELIGTEEDDD